MASHEGDLEEDKEHTSTNEIPMATRQSTRPKNCSGCKKPLNQHTFGYPGPNCQGSNELQSKVENEDSDDEFAMCHPDSLEQQLTEELRQLQLKGKQLRIQQLQDRIAEK